MKRKLEISFVGAGNVAHHLAKGLFDKGFSIKQIYSRTDKHAAELAQIVNAKPSQHIKDVDTAVDVVVIAVSDDVILDVVHEMNPGKALVVHTSGTTSMHVLDSFDRYGIFYPLQTFSKSRKVDLKDVPFCLECANQEDYLILEEMAGSLSDSFHHINSKERKSLHLAAVFACNFSNHMYTIAADLLNSNGLDFDLLKPLINETATKLHDGTPEDMQTGPAKRQDTDTIKNHLQMLEESKDYKDIYELITNHIIKLHGKL